MNRRQFTPARMLLMLGLFASAILWSLSDARALRSLSGLTVGTASAECSIDLMSDSTTCHGEAVRVLSLEDRTALVRLTLDPAQYQRARFDVTYHAAPIEWTVNIGDSASNNGGGGDAGDQTYDAELQVYNGQFLVRGNDTTPLEERSLVLIDNFAWADATVSFTISNEHLEWRSGDFVTGSLDTSFLYGLKGQPDQEQGGINYDIYAAFNRVIDENSAFGYPRLGSGVSEVIITLE